MSGIVLTINAGSSSIKFALFNGPGEMLLRGELEKMGAAPHFKTIGRDGHVLCEQDWQAESYEDLLKKILSWIEIHAPGRQLIAAGHRIVHGGADFVRPVKLDGAALEALAGLEPLAPLHQPHNLKAVRTIARLRPELFQVGCFDTAFHHAMDGTARRFALPRAMEAKGIRRYGFHGLSYEYVAGRLKQIEPVAARGRIVVAHLGSGASLCAMRDGVSLDTSMGFTPLDGLVMGTRCGALDPGVLLYLVKAGMDGAALEDLLYRRSGLLGVSGISEDMRVLLASDSAAAREAVDLFVFRAAREIAAMTASLEGVDGLVFTGGIGENSPEIRERIAARLEWLGLRLDGEANRGGATRIDRGDGGIRVWRIPTDEEAVIASHTFSLAAGALAAG